MKALRVLIAVLVMLETCSLIRFLLTPFVEMTVLFMAQCR